MYSRAYIEISNVCNLKCSFCPEVGRANRQMDVSSFARIIQQTKPLVKEITLHLMGEPLAHPEFSAFIARAQLESIPVQLTTNGTLIKRSERRSAIESPTIRQINFSIQSLFDNFPEDEAILHCREILTFANYLERIRPELYINFRLWNLKAPNQLDLENSVFFSLLKEFYPFNISALDIRRKKSHRLVQNTSLHFDSRFIWPSLLHPIVRDTGYCYGLKNHFGILVDGTVVPCCLDKEASIPLGKIDLDDSTSLQKILHSPRASAIRESFDRFEVQEELCKRCTFIKRFDRKVNKAVLTPPSDQCTA